MYEMEVTVTTYTPEVLKLTADWPLICCKSKAI
jgi:hypothetical protein